MAGIRSKNTRPEMTIRKCLFKLGYRYRIHSPLPGRPDIVLKASNAVIFIHGCFWHGHSCHLFKLPKTRSEFWESKIERNRFNDAKSLKILRDSGWRVAVVWECSIRGKGEEYISKNVVSKLANWINSRKRDLHIKG